MTELGTGHSMDGFYLCRIHADAGWRDHVAHKGHFLPIELTLLHLCIRHVLSQDLQNAPDVLDMLGGVFREDDDVIQQPDADDIQVLFENIIHEVLKTGRCIGGTLGTDQVLVVAFLTPEGSLPLVPLPDPHLVIGVAEVNLGEDLRKVEAVQHLRYEGQGEAVFDGDLVETPVVDYHRDAVQT